MHAGLVDLTGGFGESVRLSSLEPAVLKQRMLDHVQGSDLLGCGSTQANEAGSKERSRAGN